MSLMVWNSLFSVGVNDIDEQHKKLVALLNDLNTAYRNGRGKDSLGYVLADLLRYTQYHFGFEEYLMDVHKYPDTASHKHQHQVFISRIAEFQAKFWKDEAALDDELMAFLRDWLVNHIMNTDRLLAKDLNLKDVF